MRLLLVSQDFPPDIGGTQTYAWELAQRFSDRTDSFAVIAPNVAGCEAFDEKCPFDVIRVSASYDTFPVRAAPVIAREMRLRDTSVTFSVAWPSRLACGIATRIAGVGDDTILHALAAHGRELLFEPSWMGPVNRLYNRLRRRSIQGADIYFPVSRYTGGLLDAFDVDEEAVHVVNNGTDPSVFRPVDPDPLRRELGLPDAPVILTVCRLVERKGVDTLIDALPSVQARVPRVHLVIGGEGPEEAALRERIAARGVGDRVHFVGRIPYSQLRDLYCLGDVFALPARESVPDVEGFGIVFLEANACERPVVGADTGGISDAVVDGETGLLVPPDDPAALAEALSRLLRDDDLRRRMGLAGRRRVETKLNWDRIADRLLNEIEQAAL